MRSTTRWKAAPSPPHFHVGPKGCGGPPPGNAEPCFLPAHKLSPRHCLAAQQTRRGFHLPRDGGKAGHQGVVPLARDSIALFQYHAELSLGASQLPTEQAHSSGRGQEAQAARKTTRPDKNTAADKQQCWLSCHSMPNPHCARPPESDSAREEVFDSVQLCIGSPSNRGHIHPACSGTPSARDSPDFAN